MRLSEIFQTLTITFSSAATYDAAKPNNYKRVLSVPVSSTTAPVFASKSSARRCSARDMRKRPREIRDAGRHHCKFRVERDTVRGSTYANDQPIAPQGASFRSSTRRKRLVMCTVHTEQYSITVKLWRMPRGLIASPRTGQRLRSATVSH